VPDNTPNEFKGNDSMKLIGNATATALPPCRNTLLADEFGPVARTRNWHWNVKTPEGHNS